MLPIQVLIVEDDPMARTLFEIYLKNSEKYKVAGSVESAAMAELYCLTKQIDLILMDVCTALHASGLDAAEKIKKNHPGIKILIVTSRNVILSNAPVGQGWTASGTRNHPKKKSCL